MADMKYEAKDQTNGTPDANSLTSFHAGIIMDVPLASMISIQPALMLTGKGSKVEYSGNNWNYTKKFNPMYVELPVNLLIKPTIGTNTKLYFGAGPYIAAGVGGKVSYSGNVGDLSGYSDHNIQFGNDNDDDVKPMDVGANVLAGFEFGNGLIVGAQYGMSFTNNAPNGDDNANKILRNKVLSISVGYLFP